MLNPVKEISMNVFTFVDKGLNHPNFFGKFVSWGIFFGSLYLVSTKVHDIGKSKMKTILDNAWIKLNLPFRNVQCNHNVQGNEKIVEIVRQIICKKCQKVIYEDDYEKETDKGNGTVTEVEKV